MFTLPATEPGEDPQSSLESALDSCRRRGRSPAEAWIASPFFDLDDDYSPLAANLCKQMSRRSARRLRVCVPTIGETDPSTVPRLAAPKALLDTPDRFNTRITVEALPQEDADRNRRRWHAKMLALQEAEYSALMVGSSNFTRAGMGVGPQRNAEANLLMIVDRVHHGREHRQLESVWSDMERIDDPEQAEWIGAQPDAVEEEQPAAPPLPAGFLAATYQAGDRRVIVMRLDADNLPDDWSVHASAPKGEELIDAASWRASGSRETVEIEWARAQPPERLLVRWSALKAFLALNVEDARQLPPPEHTEGMSSDDMLWILAATDPSAAFRAWARGRRTSDGYDEELDSAAPIDLDPLRRYDVGATFLHRVRRRARVLAQLRTNLERPIWSLQALDWRLRGFISPEALGDRLVRDLENANGKADEALLALADFLIVLRDVNYSAADGGLTRQRFDDVYMPFLAELAESLDRRVADARNGVSREALGFWNRTVALCRAQ